MAARPIWRGHLRLALVSCPVALYSARHDRGSVRFNMINPATGNRVKMVTQDSETEEPLVRSELVKGYEVKKNHYVIITDEDLQSVKVESSELMSVEKFVEAGSLDPIYFDASYYLVPDGKAGIDVYAVLREAINEAGRLALARVVISQRERTIAIRPMGRGLVAQTLYEDRDLHPAAPMFEDVVNVRIDPEMVKLATQLIDRQTGRYDAADVEDRYETRLRAMLDAKVKGMNLEDHPAEVVDENNVINLMDALRKSLGQAPSAPRSDNTSKVAVPSQAAASSGRKSATRAGKMTPEETRRQTALKLPIEGGRKQGKARVEVVAASALEKTARSRRKAS